MLVVDGVTARFSQFNVAYLCIFQLDLDPLGFKLLVLLKAFLTHGTTELLFLLVIVATSLVNAGNLTGATVVLSRRLPSLLYVIDEVARTEVLIPALLGSGTL